ncbi:hypothetical protein [Leadbettera azotonutricia]|uniref:PorV/PorQ family protein n=1 Tax=Leadbettera azotonutricia (strain ATCC BAA-888 / DSM 13862 / ZAS-9) TaxID=545695 RepID=F5Y720_LEAAZ|nr:hypothetical protein [Leadbettera azotonutricia]AEF81420.1 conserved hypothetical protein [Leadbettera azotonutricia ZAS-9]
MKFIGVSMHRPSPAVILALFIIFPALHLAGDTIEPFVMPQARFAGLGGNHAALGDNFYSLFTNPASFVDVEEEFSAAELSISTYGPVLELIDLFRTNSSSLDGLDLSGIIGPAGFAAGFELGGPLALGWVGRGLGLGIFNRLKSTAAISGTKIRPMVAGEILLVGGYSFRIIENGSHLLDAGFLGKGFFRGDLKLEAPIFDVGSFLEDPTDQPFGTYLGMGVDLGVRYTFRENLAAAIACYDVYSPVLVTPYDSISAFTDRDGPSGSGSSYATVRRRLDVGMKYRIRSEFIDRYISRITVMADYRDILDLTSLIPRNPILNVGLGLELTVLNALSFRMGITDALPSFGLGLDLTFMTLDFAIRGKELGLDPGIQPVYGLDLSLLFRY